MRVYIELQEKKSQSNQPFDIFSLNGRRYKLQYCVPGEVTSHGEAAGCKNYVCKIRKRAFKIYCEEIKTDDGFEKKYFLLKE